MRRVGILANCGRKVNLETRNPNNVTNMAPDFGASFFEQWMGHDHERLSEQWAMARGLV